MIWKGYTKHRYRNDVPPEKAGKWKFRRDPGSPAKKYVAEEDHPYRNIYQVRAFIVHGFRQILQAEASWQSIATTTYTFSLVTGVEESHLEVVPSVFQDIFITYPPWN